MAYTTIKKPSDYFNTVLWNGNSSAQSITGVNFQPDLVWNKSRNTAVSHRLMDSVRGVSKSLIPDDTWEEQAGEGVSSFDTDGFSFSANFGGDTNVTGQTYVAWNWLANGAGVANTDGTISSTVSANTTSGFSIVSYTSNGSASQTVGHGLGVAPNVIISKNRTDGGATYGNWVVYHSSLATANDTKILLNSTAASSSTNEWGDTDPTSTVYSVHTSGDGATNHSSDNIVAYCFAEKKGFSKFGSYTGNNSNDGTFVYTGMKPAWVLIKRINSAANWILKDNKRDSYNVATQTLLPNSSGAEYNDGAYNTIDFLSNGFKLRGGSSGVGNDTNGSEPYIYMAFAEEPLVGDNPATAR
jgi:hypothetical protein